ncbi:unnamed protein product [Ilex paraguariensis]|uniref:Dirigent protein n=1 Tax=Ilex paraguariensis TaxID=185542 RepID=A0ABC8RC37_9AQUA
MLHQYLTATTVVKANRTATSPTQFGFLNVVDNPLIFGPLISSTPVGRSQGLKASSSLETVSLFCALNFIFTEGEYNGSSLAVLGQNPLRHPVREQPIIGGSGVFRLARGIATFVTYFFDVPANNASVWT